MKLPHDFGKYELRRELGRGMFARVFLAWHRALEQNMVLKILRPEIKEEPELLERFKGEAKIMASMWHPNIVRVTDMDEWEESLYIAMEYVEGMDLEEWIKLHGIPPLEIALLMLADICRGLASAHARTIHRDLKPANMIFSRDGFVKLMDFGLARRIEDMNTGLTQVGAVMGTVAYMSPEQDMAEALDTRTDIFSVGVVAYRLLSGERPFPGGNSSEIRLALRTQNPRQLGELRPDVPAAVAAMVHLMLEKDREQRCQKIELAGKCFEDAVRQLGIEDGRAMLRRYAEDPAAAVKELEEHRREMAAGRRAPLPAVVETSATTRRAVAAADPAETVIAAAEPAPPSRRVTPAVWIGAAAALAIVAALAIFHPWSPGARTDRADASAQDHGPVVVPPAPAPDTARQAAIPSPPAPEPRPAPPGKTAGTTAGGSRPKSVGSGHTVARQEHETPAPVTPPAPAPPVIAPPAPVGDPEAGKGTLVVDLKPEVPVFVDDDKVSITGYKRMSLPPGKHTVRATLGAFEFRRDVVVEAGRGAKVEYDLLMASTGSVRVTLESADGWGNVVVDGVRRAQVAPCVVEGLAPGSHSFSVEGSQYVLDGPAQSVDVQPGKTLEVRLRLKPRGGR